MKAFTAFIFCIDCIIARAGSIFKLPYFILFSGALHAVRSCRAILLRTGILRPARRGARAFLTQTDRKLYTALMHGPQRCSTITMGKWRFPAAALRGHGEEMRWPQRRTAEIRVREFPFNLKGRGHPIGVSSPSFCSFYRFCAGLLSAASRRDIMGSTR